jgi:hypothetical protein
MATATATKAKPETAVELRVIGQGTLAGNGYPFLLVTSATELGRVHVVSYSYEGAFVGSRAQCDCMAAQYGKSCKHVLVARAYLAGAASVSHVERESGSHPGDAALPRRSNRAFSLLK